MPSKMYFSGGFAISCNIAARVLMKEVAPFFEKNLGLSSAIPQSFFLGRRKLAMSFFVFVVLAN
ncbi:MAG: hypothetical protein CK532_05520 [Flavobacteriales bacterium]|nr:MAG: hypothetical protein CK532_05520 [Flavobacteriales bacterium]